MSAHLYASLGKKLIGVAALLGALQTLPAAAQFYGAANENLPNFVCYYRNTLGQCTNYSYTDSNRFASSSFSSYFNDYRYDDDDWYMDDYWDEDRTLDDEYWDEYYDENNEDCYWFRGDYLCEDDEDDEDCYRYRGVLYCDPN